MKTTKSILSIVLAMLLLLVIVLDGMGMFVAYQSSKDLAEAAAQQAALQFVTTGGSEASAEQSAADYVRQQGGELLAVSFHKSDVDWVEAAVRSEARTYVFKYVPGLNRLTAQDAVAIVQF